MQKGAGSTGGGLLYTDDAISSYSSIFDNAVFNHTDEEDEQRVIEAIKALNSGENIENYFNVDEILRYLAVHTVLCNFDSYSSSMAQNYYIYESDGVVSILPWDYNLAFGGFESNEATECVNWAIDTPVHGVEMEDRPLINQLLSNEEYLAKYHEYLQQLVDGYLSTSSEHIDNIVQKISSYVETDPTANCTYEEFETGVETLKNFVELRGESINGQLDGTIPSTTEAQNADSTSLVDASSINLSTMGSQGGKDKGGKGMPGGGNGGDTSMPDYSQENSDE
jgi:spore coat protein CotH